jgi:hypothetical protein
MPVATPVLAAAAPGDVPGADAVFAVAIVWGALRGGDGAGPSVVIWIASQDPAIRAVSVTLLDAAGSRTEILPPSLIGKAREARAPRNRFNAYPRAELRFAATPDSLASGESALTVSYAGIPDTTPEFSSEDALAEHLQAALSRATGR